MLRPSRATVILSEVSKLYPTIDSALARIAVLTAALTLPKPTIHVLSDVHGEYAKLRHVVNNGSGSLPNLLHSFFQDQLSSDQILHLLSFIYYPREAFLRAKSSNEDTVELFNHIVRHEFELIAHLTERYPFEHLLSLIPKSYTHVFRELIIGPRFSRTELYLQEITRQIRENGRELEFLRLTARLVRNLTISELIVAGDLGDRGPRIDKCIDFISHQPNVSITWGNHDMAWMGACLGHEASIASVVRMSLRYGRLKQLEEGYGVSFAPLEALALKVYGSDPASVFSSKAESERDPLLLSRMQKAISIIQFKLEAQLIARNPHFEMSDRDLITRLSSDASSIDIDGTRYPLKDKNWPTVDPKNPAQLSEDEQICIDALGTSFLASPVMWKQMQYVAQVGALYLVRDNTLIFHGCVAVDPQGEFLSFPVDGVPKAGRALFDALEYAVQRAFRYHNEKDLDLLWYLWCGPLSPVFGKDKIATFESYFIEDTNAHTETKNAYFSLIHQKDFCRKVLSEFGVQDPDGLIVNGHVPVKIEQGESPIKKSGMAVTIDGAFSESYGDKGYTLVLDADRSYLAQHGHFDSVEASLTSGADMRPEIIPLKTFPTPRKVQDTEIGEAIRQEITLLNEVIKAFKENSIREQF